MFKSFRLFLAAACTLFFSASIAQSNSGVLYPNNYFSNPLRIPIALSGNFGELRPNHYHMGLDLKTDSRENLPVYAAADGFVSRIKIEPGGFGRAIYVSHPNGFTTLYAHLNNFNPRLEDYVKRKQYELESWEVMLELTPDLFPVRKGEFLAYSGNTGGSQGPHLHFEIRTTAEDINVNPMLFGLPIADNTTPRLLRLGIYDRRKSVYEQAPRIFALKSIGAGKYSSNPSIITVSSPRISLAIGAYDTHTGSTNQNGIYSASLEVDGTEITGFVMDKISYDDTRYLNAHIDYRLKTGGGPYIQHLSELPGYQNSIYRNVNGNGLIDLSDEQVHEIRIVARDAHGNESVLTSQLQYRPTFDPIPTNSSGRLFYPGMLDGFEAEQCEFYISENCLYDSVHLNYSVNSETAAPAITPAHTIGYSYIPLQDSFLVRLRPPAALDPALKDRTVMQCISGSRRWVQKVEWQNEWAAARFRDLGTFNLLTDTEPPKVIPIGFRDGSNLSKATRIVFTVNDNLARFKNVRAELDGKWLRFTNDKGRNFIYRFDERCGSGDHELKIHVEDEAGNIAEERYRFTR